jgi:cyclopropane-fatty-acyl-phospholipid synthase
MRKYMWPNSCLPSATALITAANTGSEGRFTLEGVENHAARKYLFGSHVILNH